MPRKNVDRYVLWQRTDQQITLTKNANWTQDSTDGNALTAYLYSEDSADPVQTGGIDVTVGSPTGSAADTDITFLIDTLTGITLAADTWFEFMVKDNAGNVLVPNAVTADRVMFYLRKQPSG